MTQLDIANAQTFMRFNVDSEFMLGFKQITTQVSVCFLFFTVTTMYFMYFFTHMHMGKDADVSRNQL